MIRAGGNNGDNGNFMKHRKNDLFKKILILCIDVALIVISMVFAYIITKESAPKTDYASVLIWFLGNIALVVFVYKCSGLYSIIFSSASIIDALRLCFAIFCILVANIIYTALSGRDVIGFSTCFVYASFLFLFTGMTRFYKRAFNVGKYYISTNVEKKKRVMVVGAGKSGATLIAEMQSSDKTDFVPVCAIDDDPEKIGKSVCGVKVVGSTYEIKKYAKKYSVNEIHVTMPSVDKRRLSKIIARCNDAGCPVKILPGLYQLADGQVSVSSMREVDIQDLLGRDPVTVDINEIIGYIEDKTVLVTGGGGSIGSELCRQIASHNPKRLIILDIYENNAYNIEQELKRKLRILDLVTLIASVRDYGKMKDVFAKYRPQIVFHAAAHKHVPLMETSPNEAVKNNVFGTFNVARCADACGVETFVQISTDKAVNPTNVMGATKRICEMIIQAFGRHSKTKFVAVRFGNVLGSNGSVIPLFKQQIKEGGPVTVTHKDIIRYFMTIPEAVSLVLQAGAYAKGGQIFVLDMGEPVRIYDLAYNLIKLSGFKPDVDIKIECTGLRPGEKLYEERLMDEEGMQKTPNGLINIAQPLKFDESSFWNHLNELYEAAYAETDEMKRLVRDIVPTYKIDDRD